MWGGMGGMGWMWLWWVLIVLGVVAVAFGLIRAATPGNRGAPGRSSGGRSSARQILDERYARGEIDEEEYRKRRREIDGE